MSFSPSLGPVCPLAKRQTQSLEEEEEQYNSFASIQLSQDSSPYEPPFPRRENVAEELPDGSAGDHETDKVLVSDSQNDNTLAPDFQEPRGSTSDTSHAMSLSPIPATPGSEQDYTLLVVDTPLEKHRTIFRQFQVDKEFIPSSQEEDAQINSDPQDPSLSQSGSFESDSQPSDLDTSKSKTNNRTKKSHSGISVSAQDVDVLEQLQGQWLNSDQLEKCAQSVASQHAAGKSLTVFTPNHVKTHIRNLNVPSHTRWVAIPVNSDPVEGSHWSLLLLDIVLRAAYYFDPSSFGPPTRGGRMDGWVSSALAAFTLSLPGGQEANGTTVPLWTADREVQDDGWRCGYHLLAFLDAFLRNCKNLPQSYVGTLPKPAVHLPTTPVNANGTATNPTPVYSRRSACLTPDLPFALADATSVRACDRIMRTHHAVLLANASAPASRQNQAATSPAPVLKRQQEQAQQRQGQQERGQQQQQRAVEPKETKRKQAPKADWRATSDMLLGRRNAGDRQDKNDPPFALYESFIQRSRRSGHTLYATVGSIVPTCTITNNNSKKKRPLEQQEQPDTPKEPNTSALPHPHPPPAASHNKHQQPLSAESIRLIEFTWDRYTGLDSRGIPHSPQYSPFGGSGSCGTTGPRLAFPPHGAELEPGARSTLVRGLAERDISVVPAAYPYDAWRRRSVKDPATGERVESPFTLVEENYAGLADPDASAGGYSAIKAGSTSAEGRKTGLYMYLRYMVDHRSHESLSNDAKYMMLLRGGVLPLDLVEFQRANEAHAAQREEAQPGITYHAIPEVDDDYDDFTGAERNPETLYVPSASNQPYIPREQRAKAPQRSSFVSRASTPEYKRFVTADMARDEASAASALFAITGLRYLQQLEDTNMLKASRLRSYAATPLLDSPVGCPPLVKGLPPSVRAQLLAERPWFARILSPSPTDSPFLGLWATSQIADARIKAAEKLETLVYAEADAIADATLEEQMRFLHDNHVDGDNDKNDNEKDCIYSATLKALQAREEYLVSRLGAVSSSSAGSRKRKHRRRHQGGRREREQNDQEQNENQEQEQKQEQEVDKKQKQANQDMQDRDRDQDQEQDQEQEPKLQKPDREDQKLETEQEQEPKQKHRHRHKRHHHSRHHRKHRHHRQDGGTEVQSDQQPQQEQQSNSVNVPPLGSTLSADALAYLLQGKACHKQLNRIAHCIPTPDDLESAWKQEMISGTRPDIDSLASGRLRYVVTKHWQQDDGLPRTRIDFLVPSRVLRARSFAWAGVQCTEYPASDHAPLAGAWLCPPQMSLAWSPLVEPDVSRLDDETKKRFSVVLDAARREMRAVQPQRLEAFACALLVLPDRLEPALPWAHISPLPKRALDAAVRLGNGFPLVPESVPCFQDPLAIDDAVSRMWALPDVVSSLRITRLSPEQAVSGARNFIDALLGKGRVANSGDADSASALFDSHVLAPFDPSLASQKPPYAGNDPFKTAEQRGADKLVLALAVVHSVAVYAAHAADNRRAAVEHHMAAAKLADKVAIDLRRAAVSALPPSASLILKQDLALAVSGDPLTESLVACLKTPMLEALWTSFEKEKSREPADPMATHPAAPATPTATFGDLQHHQMQPTLPPLSTVDYYPDSFGGCAPLVPANPCVSNGAFPLVFPSFFPSAPPSGISVQQGQHQQDHLYSVAPPAPQQPQHQQPQENIARYLDSLVEPECEQSLECFADDRVVWHFDNGMDMEKSSTPFTYNSLSPPSNYGSNIQHGAIPPKKRTKKTATVPLLIKKSKSDNNNSSKKKQTAKATTSTTTRPKNKHQHSQKHQQQQYEGTLLFA